MTKGIIRFFLSAGTDEKIFSQKRAGLKHYKATSIIVDITFTASSYILTGVFLVMIHLYSFLQKMKFPYEIKLITSRGVVCLNPFGRNSLQEDLTALFVNEFEYSAMNIVDQKYIDQAISQSIDVLMQDRKSKQKSIILISNSIHYFNDKNVRYLVE